VRSKTGKREKKVMGKEPQYAGRKAEIRLDVTDVCRPASELDHNKGVEEKRDDMPYALTTGLGWGSTW